MGIFLETKRLILKTPEMSDYENLLALRTDQEVMQYIFSGVQTPKQVKEFIENTEPYFKQYGLAFCSVFEKETNQFIGQAGIFHLRFNVNQPEFEVAYRLHKKYWNNGYATELAKGLIDWGFKHLSVDKLCAIVFLGNEKSRQVLQKAGMHYVGKLKLDNVELAKYEIDRKIDVEKIKLVPASLDDLSIIQNMGRFYIYDISEHFPYDKTWAIPENGLYESIDFSRYFSAPNTFPFLIRYENELAGCVVIDKQVIDSNSDFNVAQFFVLRKFKNNGIGRHVAFQCFDKFNGNWEVIVIPGNESGYRFWRSIIKEYTHNHFLESTEPVPHFNNVVRNVFKFKSNRC